ncbi:MAG TPA: ABC transporter permease [Nocardioidaceae bacterium]|nr:ABC transporter permease [Nocardioidaceae bacterium]
MVERLIRARELSLVIIIIALIAGTAGAQPSYLFSQGGWRDLLRGPAMLIVVAIGEAMVILTRNIDLSVGSILGLTTYLCGDLMHLTSLPNVVIVVIGLAFGAALGLINGLLVAFLNVPSLVITLGTQYAFRGVAVLWIGGRFIRPEWVPNSFKHFGLSQILTIPWLLVVAVIVMLASGWFLSSRRTGREFYALGSNPDAAILYGLRTRQLTLIPFVLSGLLAGLGGIIYLSIFATGDSKVGFGFEFQAIAAAVVGGVAITGGSGRIWGVALGGFFLATLNTALPVLNVPSLWQQAVVGLLIVAAITLDRALFVARQRQARKAVHA